MYEYSIFKNFFTIFLFKTTVKSTRMNPVTKTKEAYLPPWNKSSRVFLTYSLVLFMVSEWVRQGGSGWVRKGGREWVCEWFKKTYLPPRNKSSRVFLKYSLVLFMVSEWVSELRKLTYLQWTSPVGFFWHTPSFASRWVSLGVSECLSKWRW